METLLDSAFEVFLPFVSPTVGGIPIAVGVVLLVHALGVAGLTKTSNHKRLATLIVALVLSAVWGSTQAQAGMTYAEWVALVYRALIGALLAGLGYVTVIEPRRKPKP